jgi:broad specificity phosphatase PhoE
MKIIYCHHAERAVDPRKHRSQDDDITENGFQDAQLVADILSKEKITAIYTSSFYRCRKTAQIINSKIGAPIYEDARFNEVGSIEGEDWKDCLTRNISALNEIMQKYNDDATILCVASGVNLSAFVCWNLNIKPTKDFPFMGATNCTPIVFYEATPTKYRECKFDREYSEFRYRKNKDYLVLNPTFGEMKTNLKYTLKQKIELIDKFKNKFRREEYLAKLGEVERALDMGEIESKKYLANKLSIESMQLLKDISMSENIDYDTIRTTKCLNMNEDECIEKFSTYCERLFYVDTKLDDTLLLLYSTLVSYINYNDLIYEDIEKMCIISEKEEGSYYKGKLIYKL